MAGPAHGNTPPATSSPCHRETMSQMELDVKRMPLGRLSTTQVCNLHFNK